MLREPPGVKANLVKPEPPGVNLLHGEKISRSARAGVTKNEKSVYMFN